MTGVLVTHWIIEHLFKLLKLEPIPIMWAYLDYSGEYDDRTRIIKIDVNECKNDPEWFRMTVSHEVRHYWQHVNGLLNTEILFGITDKTLPYNWRYEELEAEEFSTSLEKCRTYRYVPKNETLGCIIQSISKHPNVQRRLVKVLARARYEYMNLREDTSYKDFIEYLKFKTILKGGD